MKKKQKILLPGIICFFASSFYIYDYIIRVMPAGMTHALMSSFDIHAGQLGILASLFFWGYMPMQIPVGLFFDKFSARSLLTITLFLSSLAVLGFALTDSYALAIFSRFIMGLASSFAFVGALVVGANWFRGQYFALYTGLVQFFGCMGAILGIAPVTVLTSRYGWQQTSLFIAILGIGLSVVVWLVVRDAPHSQLKKLARKHNAKKKPTHYRAAFSNPQTWWVGVFGFAIWSPVTIFAALWGVPFFRDVYHLSSVDAGSQVSIIWFSIAFGGPLVGWLSKHFRTRRIPMVICSVLGIFSSLILVHFTHLSQITLSILLVLFGLGAAGLVLAFGLVVDLQPPEAIGTIIGFTNMAVILGGATLQPIVGFVLHHLWTGATSQGTYVYSAQAYETALLMIPFSFLLALIMSFLVKETHCEKQHEY